MRALIVVVAVGSLVGCSKSDPCSGVAGTCLSLTVQSSTVSMVDSLQIMATGAVTGSQTTSGPRSSLPIHVAVKLPSTSGALHLDVLGDLGGMVVGSGSTDATITAGQHASATVTLVAIGGGGEDMASTDMAGSTDDMAGGRDMGAVPCDPKGVTGPQCVWRWQTPLPQGADLIGVVAFSDVDTIALSTEGLLVHRDGTSWAAMAKRPVSATGDYYVGTIFGGGIGNDVYIGATRSGIPDGGVSTTTIPIVFHSADKGGSWTEEMLPGNPTGYAYTGSALSGTAIMPSGGGIYVRDSSTNTWSAKNVGAGPFYGSAISTNGSAVAAGYGSNALIAYSKDYGASWTLVPTGSITPSTAFLTGGACIGAGAGLSWWVVGNGVILKASGNTPTTWTSQPGVPANLGLKGCIATDDLHAIAFGANGSVLITSDGTNWAGLGSPPATSETLNAGAHSTATAITLVGTNGVIFRSTNGGTSYNAERTGVSDRLAAAWGITPANIWAVGAAGTIYHSSDGSTWAKLSSAQAGTSADLSAIWASSATDIYAVGNNVILHSSDGATFTAYGSLPANTTLNDVFGSSQFGVYAVGVNGTGSSTRVVYRSTDHGTTWNPVTITGFTGVAGTNFRAYTVYATATDVFVGGDGGNIYHSSDGTTFASQNGGLGVVVGNIRGVNGKLFALLGSDPGSYLWSTNNGGTWNQQLSVSGGPCSQLAATPTGSSLYLASPSADGLDVSTDNGQSWTLLNTKIVAVTNVALNGIVAFADNNIYVATNDGMIHYGN